MPPIVVDEPVFYPPLSGVVDEPATIQQTPKTTKANDVVTTPKNTGWKSIVLDLFLHSGDLVIPILFWLAVVALIAGYINKANWNFVTRMRFYWVIATLCFLYLITRHGTSHQITQKIQALH